MLKTKFENNVLTAFIEGELDHDSAARIRTKLDGICESITRKIPPDEIARRFCQGN